MPMESNKPVQRVHNGGDGIWDGAAWGAAAGAGATAVAYGTGVHLPGRAQNRIERKANKSFDRMFEKNSKREAAGKRHLDEAGLTKGMDKIISKSDKGIGRWGKVAGAGDFAFGSKKRMVASAATGLLGGMVGGAAVDHFR